MLNHIPFISHFRSPGHLLVIFYLLIAQFAFSQSQPLSRNDKAQVQKSIKAFENAKSKANTKEASRHLNDIAYLYWEHNDYNNAIIYYEQSLQLNEVLNNENGMAMLHNNLGMLYADIKEYDKSLSYFKLTLAARRAFKNKEGIIAALKNISVVENNLKMFKESVAHLEEALTTARESNDPEQISSCYLMLSETYEKAGDAQNMKKYYELYQTFYNLKHNQDLQRLQGLANEEAILKEIAEIKAQKQQAQLNVLNRQLDEASKELDQFDADKVELSAALSKTQLQVQFLETEQENERLRNEEAMRRARAFRNLLFVGALSLLLISFFIYKNYKQELRSKKALAKKNEQINAQNVELEDLNKIIAKHNYRMQTELNIGRDIQMSMLPSDFPEIEGIDLYASLVPALEVGGDLYDFFKIDDENLIFGVGDVSDKGVPAALFMAVTKTLVKTNSNYSSLPGKILTQVNKSLSEDNDTAMFVTYFLCVLNTKTGEIAYTNAGHNPPLLIRPDGNLKKLKDLHGPVLGAVEDFEYGQSKTILVPQTQLVIYTDGVTEAMDQNNNQYSNERLDQIFNNNGTHNAKESVESIIEDVKKFRGSAEQSDDITILSLVYKGG